MPAYKNKKRGTWYAAFYYKDWTGKKLKKKKEGFKTRREAQTYERKFLETAHANPNMTFEALVKIYMEDCKTRLKPTTYANKEYVINLKVLPYFKNMRINEIEPATIRKWQNKLLNHENNYSMTYLKTTNNQLSAIFNFAMKYYKLPTNPARISGSMGKKNSGRIAFWTKYEFDQFMTSVEDSPIYKTIFTLLFWTGMRIGETLALTLDDFDFREQTVSVTKNYARHEGQDLILEPKTPKSKRTITIPRAVSNIVQEYLTVLYDYQPHDRLFPITRTTMNGVMKRKCKEMNLKRIRIHDLRHSHASLLIEMGFSPLLISERLGHENIETTLQTYSHLYPDKHGEVAAKLQELIEET
ncbi:site-specific integrase [Gottschalkiaceae bacterium SANA]|nr:site-specific integrase [Gottschalkiaceae bacterium SANA]